MGILRFALALDVLFWHLPIASAYLTVPPLIPFSFIAVCVFFIISGFYMALVLNETYHPGVIGLTDFFVNRALRIFCPYLLVLLVTIIIARLAGIQRLDLLGGPGGYIAKTQMLLYNASLIPAAFNLIIGYKTNFFLLFGQMFTVGLELIFYILAPSIVRRSLPVLLTIFFLAATAHFLPYELGLPPRPWQYEFFPCILMFFLLGTLSYRLYDFLKQKSFDRRYGWLALPLISGYSISGVLHGQYGFTNDIIVLTFYVMIGLLIPFLFLASKSVRWDRFIGDLSYPLYIVHMPVIKAVGLRPSAETLIVIWSIALSICLVLLVDRPLDRWRHSFSATGSGAVKNADRMIKSLNNFMKNKLFPKTGLQNMSYMIGGSAIILLLVGWETFNLLTVDSAKLIAQDGTYQILELNEVYYAVPPTVSDVGTDLSTTPGVIPDASLSNLILRVDSINSGQPKLLKVIKPFNVVVFKGKFYGLPFGLAVNWSQDDIATLPGVISDDGETNVEAAIEGRLRQVENHS
jgi:peptidoglycan/LPS O-acetylase OafA/YrhL